MIPARSGRRPKPIKKMPRLTYPTRMRTTLLEKLISVEPLVRKDSVFAYLPEFQKLGQILDDVGEGRPFNAVQLQRANSFVTKFIKKYRTVKKYRTAQKKK